MGGIFCATAHDDVIPSTMMGLARLEHRGGDSAGVAMLVEHQIQRRRAPGPLSFLASLLADDPTTATTAIGHTRLATHGEPSRHNAHPHASSRVAVAHDGIIANHVELRAELERLGAQFRSDTDSEVIVWLLDKELAEGAHPLTALRNVLPRLEGSYALGLLCTEYDERIYAAQRGSTLVAGRADDASWLASEAAALSGVIDEVVYLEDGQIAELSPGYVHVFDSGLGHVDPRWARVENEPDVRESSKILTDVAHKEILAQPALVGRTLRELERDVTSGDVERWCGPLWRADRILAIGCGASSNAAHVARSWLEQIAGIPVDLELSSEVKSRNAPLTEGTMALLMAPSTDDEDTLEALRFLKNQAVPTVALVDMTSSALAREADSVLDYGAGQATGIRSTHAFAAQLSALAAASIAIRQLKHGDLESEGLPASIFGVPQAMESALELEEQCIDVGLQIARADRVVFMGRGMSYPLACAGARSLEALYDVRAEGSAAGEVKHRRPALFEGGTPVVVVAPHDATFDETLADVAEVIARGGAPILLGDSHTAAIAKRDGLPCIAAGRVDPVWSPLVLAIPLQLIAYHAARARAARLEVEHPAKAKEHAG